MGIKSGIMGKRMKKGVVKAKDVSNEAVLFMLVLLIIVSLISMIVYVNLLSNVDKRIPSTPPSSTPAQGVVSLRILPSSSQGDMNIPGDDARE